MKKLLCSVLFSCVTMPVLAASPFAIEASIGQSNYDFSMDGETLLSDKATSVEMRGVYFFDPNFGLEFGYVNYGEIDKVTREYDDEDDEWYNNRDVATLDAFQFGIRGQLPLDFGASLYVRAGLSAWDITYEYFDLDFGYADQSEDSGNGFYYGFGATFPISEGIKLGVDYSATPLEIFLFDQDIDLDMSSLSVTLSVSL